MEHLPREALTHASPVPPTPSHPATGLGTNIVGMLPPNGRQGFGRSTRNVRGVRRAGPVFARPLDPHVAQVARFRNVGPQRGPRRGGTASFEHSEGRETSRETLCGGLFLLVQWSKVENILSFVTALLWWSQA